MASHIPPDKTFIDLWTAAVERYQKESKVAIELDIDDLEGFKRWLNESEKKFSIFRNRWKTLRDCIKPFGEVISRLADAAGDAVSAVAPRKAIFSGVKALLEVSMRLVVIVHKWAERHPGSEKPKCFIRLNQGSIPKAEPFC